MFQQRLNRKQKQEKEPKEEKDRKEKEHEWFLGICVVPHDYNHNQAGAYLSTLPSYSDLGLICLTNSCNKWSCGADSSILLQSPDWPNLHSIHSSISSSSSSETVLPNDLPYPHSFLSTEPPYQTLFGFDSSSLVSFSSSVLEEMEKYSQFRDRGALQYLAHLYLKLKPTLTTVS